MFEFKIINIGQAWYKVMIRVDICWWPINKLFEMSYQIIYTIFNILVALFLYVDISLRKKLQGSGGLGWLGLSQSCTQGQPQRHRTSQQGHRQRCQGTNHPDIGLNGVNVTESTGSESSDSMPSLTSGSESYLESTLGSGNINNLPHTPPPPYTPQAQTQTPRVQSTTQPRGRSERIPSPPRAVRTRSPLRAVRPLHTQRAIVPLLQQQQWNRSNVASVRPAMMLRQHTNY